MKSTNQRAVRDLDGASAEEDREGGKSRGAHTGLFSVL